MTLAVLLGILIATGRVYGGGPLRALLTGYVELMRGTPILLQLFVLYYGIAAAIRLPAFAAALLGLGLNYAAYESEIYRSALEAVSPGQLEAARTLGLSERQVLRLIRGAPAGTALEIFVMSVLQVRDVHLNRGERRILDGASLDAGRGELVAIMGPSGSGKTTLLRAIAGLEPFQAGHVAVDDVTLESGPAPVD